MTNKDRQIALVKIIKSNPNNYAAKRELVESMLRFVYGVAIRISKDRTVVPELIQEAFVSVFCDAIRKYDTSSGVNFLSYSVYWIMQAMKRYVAENISIIRLPSNVANLYYRKVCGSDEDFSKYQSFIREAMSYNFVSIDFKLTDDLSIADLIGSEDEGIKDLDSKDSFDKLIKNAGLSDRELEVLLATSSYDDAKKKTYRQEAKKYGVSRERIRQIRAEAIEKLKKHKEEKDGQMYSARISTK